MKNRIVLMCGSHLRHIYVASALLNIGRLAALVIEERESFVPQPDPSWIPHYQELFRHHFEKREYCEKKYFRSVDLETIANRVSTLRVQTKELNEKKTIDFLSEHKDCILLSYGVHQLDEAIISLFPQRCFNIHGGLSPWFRGNATLFWPFYFLKPNYAGMTIHRLSNKLDGGDILHHSLPELAYGDGIHDVACKAVIQVVNDLCKILELADAGQKLTCHPQKSSSKLFVTQDWTPQTLTVIYDLYKDRIVDHYLDGVFIKNVPPVIDFLRSPK